MITAYKKPQKNISLTLVSGVRTKEKAQATNKVEGKIKEYAEVIHKKTCYIKVILDNIITIYSLNLQDIKTILSTDTEKGNVSAVFIKSIEENNIKSEYKATIKGQTAALLRLSHLLHQNIPKQSNNNKEKNNIDGDSKVIACFTSKKNTSKYVYGEVLAYTEDLFNQKVEFRVRCADSGILYILDSNRAYITLIEYNSYTQTYHDAPYYQNMAISHILYFLDKSGRKDTKNKNNKLVSSFTVLKSKKLRDIIKNIKNEA